MGGDGYESSWSAYITRGRERLSPQPTLFQTQRVLLQILNVTFNPDEGVAGLVVRHFGPGTVNRLGTMWRAGMDRSDYMCLRLNLCRSESVVL